MTMDCGLQAELGSSAYVDGLARKAYRERIPVSGAFDLTYRCNFRCRHCYAAPLVSQPRTQAGELETEDIKRILSAAADAGCLFMLLSGGEPLLREDFVDIYRHAAQAGFVITVFTNGSLVRSDHLDVFSEYPPHLVEVSLYGASEATYRRVTGVEGALRRVRQGVERLLDRDVRVGLKTMVLTDTVDEVSAMEALAGEFGLRFRMDPLVTPRLDGDPSPLTQRVDPRTVAEMELSDPKRLAKAVEYVESRRLSRGDEGGANDRLYRCGAGAVGFHIDPQGDMRPCLMSRDLGYNAVRLGFADAWRAVVEATDRVTSERAAECAECPYVLLCGYCPALFKLEQGSPSEPSKYVCRLGENRHRIVSGCRAEVESVR